MDLIKKLMGEGVPEWAQPISPKLFREFKKDVTDTLIGYIDSFGVDWPGGTIQIVLPATENAPSKISLNLHNVLHTWKECDPIERKLIVADFINRILVGLTTPKPNLRDAKDRILIRIYDYKSLDAFCVEVARDIGKYLVECLVLDQIGRAHV